MQWYREPELQPVTIFLAMRSILVVLWAASVVYGGLNWGSTKFLFTYGDSYTTDGFNISDGVNSPVPGFVSSESLTYFIGESLIHS